MNRIEAAVQHGINTVPDISHYKYIKELSDHLSKPFYVRYDDTKVNFNIKLHKNHLIETLNQLQQCHVNQY